LGFAAFTARRIAQTVHRSPIKKPPIKTKKPIILLHLLCVCYDSAASRQPNEVTALPLVRYSRGVGSFPSAFITGGTLSLSASSYVVRQADLSRGDASYVFGVRFSRNGRMLATAGTDQTVRLWDVAQRRLIKVLRGHDREAWALDFTPDGKILVSAGSDGSVHFWDTAPRPDPSVSVYRGSVESMTFSSDGKWLAMGGENGVDLWDRRTGQTITHQDSRVRLEGKTRVHSQSLSPRRTQWEY